MNRIDKMIEAALIWFLWIALMFAILTKCGTTFGQEVRDKYGKRVGTLSPATPNGTVYVRDGRGRLVGVVLQSKSSATFRDSKGRVIGTIRK